MGKGREGSTLTLDWSTDWSHREKLGWVTDSRRSQKDSKTGVGLPKNTEVGPVTSTGGEYLLVYVTSTPDSS